MWFFPGLAKMTINTELFDVDEDIEGLDSSSDDEQENLKADWRSSKRHSNPFHSANNDTQMEKVSQWEGDFRGVRI